MKHPMTTFLTRATLALSTALLVALPGPAAAVEPGQPAPELELQLAQGTKKLSDYKGKVVYLDFWASWCGPCKQSFPWMNEMQARHGAKGLQVLAVNLDAKRSDAEQFLAQNAAQFTVAFDAKAESARRMAVKGMPTSVLIDAEGKVLATHQGFREEERKTLEDALVAALARK